MRTAVLAKPAVSLSLHHFVAVVSVIGLAIIAHAAFSLPATPYPLGWTALGALALIAGSLAIKLPGVPAYVSIADTFFMTSVLLFGPAPATITIALDCILTSLRRQHAASRMLFNPTSNAIALWVAAHVFFLLAGTGPMMDSSDPPGGAIFPLTCMAAVYFLLNSGLTAIAVSIERKIPVVALWRDHFAILSLNYFAAASASFFLIVLMRFVGVTGIAAVLPLLLVFHLAMRSWLGRVDDAQRHVTTVNQLYLSTIGAFATAIEAKDGVTREHIHRVQAYALGLARELGIADESTLKAIEAASLLHDTGKLAVPEHILNKPGRLTAAEFEMMKRHVDVGADILASIDFPYPVVPIVRCHHENWDGTGYPRGLKGEEIPIGARILSVVDCFDALTSARPYRPAMTTEEALAILVDRRGTMYDPVVVDTFIRVHRDIGPAAELKPELQHALQHIRRAAKRNVESQDDSAAPHGASGLGSNEQTAFATLARLAAQRPTVPDIAALAWEQLRHLMPGATCALYTIDPLGSLLIAQFTAGPESPALRGLTMGVGQHLSGWVAAHGEAIANSDARLDLENLGDTSLRYCVGVPLTVESTIVGVLSLYSASEFSQEQSRTLQEIAPHIAIALEAARVRAVRSGFRIVASRAG